MKPRYKFLKGQIAVVLTLVMATLLGAMALGTDVGILYFNWVQLQKAADAGALAGAGELNGVAADSINAATARQYADGYACLNGIDATANNSTTVCPNPIVNSSYVDQILFTNVDATNTQVSLGLQRQVPYYFARVFGLTTGSVAAQATAKVYPSGTGHVFPALFNCKTPCNLSNLDFGTSVSFGVKFSEASGSSSSAPGNWGWLDVGQGQGGSQLKTAIEGGYSTQVSVGQSLNTVTGGKVGPVNQGWSDPSSGLLAQHYAMSSVDPSSICGGSNPDNIPNGDPLLVTVPVGDMSTCSTGNCNVTVTGFAEVYLTSLSASGSASNATISGCFVKAIAASSIGSASAPNLGSFGKPVLIQ